MPTDSSIAEPVFIDGPSGPLFAILFRPEQPEASVDECLVFVPPFAEEMNRSRPMVAMQARALARLGVTVLVLDLFGTGDSGGNFADATWAGWMGDLRAGVRWLEQRGIRCTGLWGLRFGALLALSFAAAHANRFDRLLLWQPITSGKTMVTQFLRQRVAAEMEAEGTKTSVADMRKALAEGKTIEVSGYDLSPDLIHPIEKVQLSDLFGLEFPAMDWIEVVPREEEAISPGAQRAIDGWKAAGAPLRVRSAVGLQFWALYERTMAPDVISVTRDVIGRGVFDAA